MYLILATAKTMDESPLTNRPASTEPYFLDRVETLVAAVKRLSLAQLRDVMALSEALARQTRQRFQDFEIPFTDDNSKPAVFAFAGDVYRSFDAASIDLAKLEWAQDHLGILSGLFGLLRPLDRVQPYRLEMAHRLKTRWGSNLYAFWGDRIAKRINEITAEHADPTLLNLASAEYLRVVKKPSLSCPIVTPVFLEVKPGEKGRVMAVYAKRARGLMARFIIENRINRVEAIRDFTADGYRFQTDASTPETFYFSRPYAG